MRVRNKRGINPHEPKYKWKTYKVNRKLKISLWKNEQTEQTGIFLKENEHTRKCLSFFIENLGSTSINEDINEMPFLAHQIGKNENALSYGVFVRM